MNPTKYCNFLGNSNIYLFNVVFNGQIQLHYDKKNHNQGGTVPQAPTERGVFSDTAQKGRRSTPLYNNNDTIVTLIGKPLTAKKDDFLQLHKKSPCFEKSGWKRSWVHFSPRTQNLSLRYFPESGTSSLKLLQ